MNFVLKSSKKRVGLYKGYYLKPSFLGLKTKVGLYTESAYTPGFTVFKSWQSRGFNWGPYSQKADILPTVPTMPARTVYLNPLKLYLQKEGSMWETIFFLLRICSLFLETAMILKKEHVLLGVCFALVLRYCQVKTATRILLLYPYLNKLCHVPDDLMGQNDEIYKYTYNKILFRNKQHIT